MIHIYIVITHHSKLRGANWFTIIPRQIHSVKVYTKTKYGKKKKRKKRAEVDKERDKNLRWFDLRGLCLKVSYKTTL